MAGSMVKKQTTLILVRHGEVEGDGNLHGHIDVELTDVGVAKLTEVARTLSSLKLDAVVSSDLVRAKEGAELIAAHHGGVAVETFTQLRELDMGRWDGLPLKEIWKEEEELLDRWWKDLANNPVPEGESLADLGKRVLPTLEGLVERYRGGTICMVAHGGVNRVILFAALGLSLANFHSLSQDYGCVNRIRYFDDRRTVVDLVNG